MPQHRRSADATFQTATISADSRALRSPAVGPSNRSRVPGPRLLPGLSSPSASSWRAQPLLNRTEPIPQSRSPRDDQPDAVNWAGCSATAQPQPQKTACQTAPSSRARKSVTWAFTSGRSWIRTRVGVADGFTDHSNICSDLRLCSALPNFSGYSPRRPRSRCRPGPWRIRYEHQPLQRRPLTRQAGEAASDARAEALIPMVTDAIEMPSAATQMPGNRPRPGAVPQRSATSGMRSYTGNPEPDANRRDARSPEPRREGADPADPAPDGPADNPGTRRHARTCRIAGVA
jgi:hypothetical protein